MNQNNKTNEDDSSKQITLKGEGVNLGSDNTKYDVSAIGTGYAYDVTAGYGAGSLLNEITIKQR